MSVEWPEVDCCLGEQVTCVCGSEERALRAIAAGRGPDLTDEQREWCLSEIGSIEGYRRDEHEGDNSVVLANVTIRAWADYCRDKGLLG